MLVQTKLSFEIWPPLNEVPEKIEILKECYVSMTLFGILPIIQQSTKT